MNFFIGFLIAVAVGLTGIGGGSFTVPALVLIVGLTAGEAVGTAFVFAGVLDVFECELAHDHLGEAQAAPDELRSHHRALVRLAKEMADDRRARRAGSCRR